MAVLFPHKQLKQTLLKKAFKICSIYHRLSSDKVLTLEVNKFDVIDNFTSDLIHQKSLKWEGIKLRKNHATTCSLVQPKTLEIALNNMSQSAIDKQFLLLIQDGSEHNIEEFIKRCQRSLVCPTFTNVLTLLDANSRNANINIILELKKLFKEDNDYYKTNAYFDHYLAEAYWINGEIVKAVQILEDVYEKNAHLRRRLRLMLKYLITDVTTHSEAILVSIIKFGEKLYNSYKDPFALICVWQACFISEWYSDQTLALQLLEKNKGLCEAVVGTLPYVVTASLKNHQVEVVYRLLELLIKYEMKTQYSAILVSIFNYKFYIGDLKSCSEIIQWSVTYNVALPNIIHERFLMLLLRRKNVDDMKPDKPPEPKVDLKF
ncbi:uncharacterized protein [Atheta coriaria]|uniref:uncharacterized protein n=1 Tax=Dalotia coriaria TaxID=877792 RepID=UPI0031F39811